MSSDNNIPLHLRGEIAHMTCELHGKLLSMAKDSLDATVVAMVNLDLNDESSLVVYAGAAERSAQILGLLLNTLNGDRNKVQASASKRGNASELGESMTLAGQMAASAVRGETCRLAAAVREAHSTTLLIVEAALNNGSDN